MQIPAPTLEALRIRNLAVIEDVCLEPGSGLNVLTGETGAGKSIIVEALNWLAGARADATRIRAGAARAVVEAVLRIPEGHRAMEEALQAAGFELDADRMLLLRRDVAPGGGKAWVQGSPATVSVLRSLGEAWIAVLGQQEAPSLRRPEAHLEWLDAAGIPAELLDEVRTAYGRLREAAERVRSLERARVERSAREAELRSVVEAIESVAPQAGEVGSLEVERNRLRHAAAIAEAASDALRDLYEAEDAASALAARAQRKLESVAAYDPDLASVAAQVQSARVELEDAGSRLRDLQEGWVVRPGRLETVEARLAALERLLLRFGPAEEDALARLAEAREELDALAKLDDAGADALRERERAAQAYVAAAQRLRRRRQAAARELAERLQRILRDLDLPHVSFETRFSPASGTPVPGHENWRATPAGSDQVEFWITTNPGEPLRPLRKVASGGELSRIMLALHTALDEPGPPRVLVFDEVDAGVGGDAADAVGARLRALSRTRQVFCVTHLPQVAAYAARHFLVRKRRVAGRVRVDARALGNRERVAELARMLGGRRAGEASARNAEALLAAVGSPEGAGEA